MQNEIDADIEVTLIIKQKGKSNLKFSAESTSVQEAMDLVYDAAKWSIIKGSMLKKIKESIKEKVEGVKDFFDVTKWF